MSVWLRGMTAWRVAIAFPASDDCSVGLGDEVDLDAARGGLLDAVRDTAHPAHASVWLR